MKFSFVVLASMFLSAVAAQANYYDCHAYRATNLVSADVGFNIDTSLAKEYAIPGLDASILLSDGTQPVFKEAKLEANATIGKQSVTFSSNYRPVKPVNGGDLSSNFFLNLDVKAASYETHLWVACQQKAKPAP